MSDETKWAHDQVSKLIVGVVERCLNYASRKVAEQRVATILRSFEIGCEGGREFREHVEREMESRKRGLS